MGRGKVYTSWFMVGLQTFTYTVAPEDSAFYALLHPRRLPLNLEVARKTNAKQSLAIPRGIL